MNTAPESDGFENMLQAYSFVYLDFWTSLGEAEHFSVEPVEKCTHKAVAFGGDGLRSRGVKRTGYPAFNQYTNSCTGV